MLFNNELYELRAPNGYILIADLENHFIKSDNEILRSEGTAYDEVAEGSGQIVKIKDFSRLGVVTDIGGEANFKVAEEGLKVGDLVFYIAQAATFIPIGPSTVVSRIPVTSILGIVNPVDNTESTEYSEPKSTEILK